MLDIPPENVLQQGAPRSRAASSSSTSSRAASSRTRRSSAATSRARPYREWVERERVRLADLPRGRGAASRRWRRSCASGCQQVFGYTREDLRILLAPMAAQGKWPLGSMGEDAALACLSDRPQLLYHYFKQLFAQVTNPPMDSINERPVMSLYSTLGAEQNLLEETPEHARMLRVEHPVLTDEELERLRADRSPGFRARTLLAASSRWPRAATGSSARARPALPRGRATPCASGVNILILSDRGVSPELAPIPMLLATGAVHHHLIREDAAHALRARLRDRRGARGGALGAADRLRRGRGESLPRASRRSTSWSRRAPTCPRTSTPTTARKNFVKAVRQGPAQDLREDGHLDAAELPRRADLRGDRPRPRAGRRAASRARRRASRASAST